MVGCGNALRRSFRHPVLGLRLQYGDGHWDERPWRCNLSTWSTLATMHYASISSRPITEWMVVRVVQGLRSLHCCAGTARGELDGTSLQNRGIKAHLNVQALELATMTNFRNWQAQMWNTLASAATCCPMWCELIGQTCGTCRTDAPEMMRIQGILFTHSLVT